VSEAKVSLKQVLERTQHLSAVERLRLVELVIPDLEVTLAAASKKPLRASYGVLADLGSAPSAEEIDERDVG
jgi:hypothetical protein